MPQITIYIDKEADRAWREANPQLRSETTDKMRSLLRRQLQKATSGPQEARGAADASNHVESAT